MAVAWQTQTDLFEAAKHAPPARVGANMAGERRRRPFEAGPRHARRRPRLAGDIVQQQLFGGRMAAHGSSFSNASRKRPRARRMRDFTVPSGSFSSSAMTVCVLSSKKAFLITTS